MEALAPSRPVLLALDGPDPSAELHVVDKRRICLRVVCSNSWIGSPIAEVADASAGPAWGFTPLASCGGGRFWGDATAGAGGTRGKPGLGALQLGAGARSGGCFSLCRFPRG